MRHIAHRPLRTVSDKIKPGMRGGKYLQRSRSRGPPGGSHAPKDPADRLRRDRHPSTVPASVITSTATTTDDHNGAPPRRGLGNCGPLPASDGDQYSGGGQTICVCALTQPSAHWTCMGIRIPGGLVEPGQPPAIRSSSSAASSRTSVLCVVLVMIFSHLSHTDHPSLVRPHWPNALAAAVTPLTFNAQIRHFVMAITEESVR
jgi:hypothetical protein